LQSAWDAAGLSERVSEVNLFDLRDIRAQLADDNSQIEVRLGAQDHGKRLRDALEVLDAQKQSPHGALISYIDLSQGKRAIVGLTSGAHTSDVADAASSQLESTSATSLDRDSPGTPQRNSASNTPKRLETKPKPERNAKTAAQQRSDAAKKSERRKQ
jgi:hypothetical protein